MMKNGLTEEIEDRYLAGTYQKIPVVAARAKGTKMWDMNGKEYFDFMSGYGVAILGHSNNAITEAIKKQVDEIYITHTSVYSPARARFLRELMNVTPTGLNMAYLSNSGAEAIEAALKIAVKSTKRKKIISMEKGYHGKTLGALSITHSAKYRSSFEDMLIPGVEFVKFGDYEHVHTLLKKEDVAAVFMEPIQGEGGINLPDPQFLPSVREATSSYGTLLVMDEIQSGLGRTGKMWAHENWGITPDIMTIGKGIGGGIPMGVTVGKREFVESLGIGEQSSTTGGNPLSCAAGEVVIKELRNGMIKRASEMGKYTLQRMNEETDSHRLVSQTRGIGMMLAMELRVRFVPILMDMIDLGLITLYSGINTIRMLPPYTVSKEEVDRAIEILKTALDQYIKKQGRNDQK
ncbi:MAG: acetylornithine aminotransferase [Thermoplasmatales archaeon Gpl]|jgi:acetylornithine/LysW-gamma-L-lysine aminotransferase|nr:MAG: acetylornithine aminotransferase [Thermoplasmatales archaeon Gpl]